jgi:hypothetical protein
MKEAVKHLETKHKTGRQLFKCNHCKEFTSMFTLAIYYHMQGHYENYKKTCKCGTKFTDNYSYRQHLYKCGKKSKKIVPDPVQAKKPEPEKKPVDNEKAQKHKGVHYCYICTKPQQNINEMKLHLEKKHFGVSGGFNCSLCKDFQTINAGLAYAHLKECKKRTICGICGKNCLTRKNFHTHLARHRSRIVFKCQYCDKEIAYKWGLQRHVESVHPGKKLTKFVPVKNFTSQALKVRSKKLPSVAETEEKKTKAKNYTGNLGMKNYCFYCRVEKSSVKNMILHVKAKHRSKNGMYKCTKCPKSSISARQIFYHISDHLK